MQILHGEHLSGEYGFKITKCILSGKSKAFTAIYCTIIEYSQVIAWWLTNGTEIEVLREVIEKINKRYVAHEFDGVKYFTTDCCCQQQSY